MRGIDIIVEIEDDGSFKVVGGQRGATLAESSETIDTTTKDSGGVYEYDYGLYGWTISADGMYIKDDEGFNLLGQAMQEKKKVRVQFKESGDITKVGQAIVVSRELEGPYDAEATYSIEFQGTGKLEKPESTEG